MEVDVPHDRAHPISGSFSDKVNETFDKIHPTLVKTRRPTTAAWKEINHEMYVEQAEVELDLNRLSKHKSKRHAPVNFGTLKFEVTTGDRIEKFCSFAPAIMEIPDINFIDIDSDSYTISFD